MAARSRGLAYGLLFAIVLVYLLMVVNFQSWLDPFIILMALPGALAGIVVDPVPHGHDASVPALDGRDHVRRRRDREQHPRGDFANEQRKPGATRAAPRSPPA